MMARCSEATRERGKKRAVAMNFLILGDGPEELAWARAVADHPEHQLAVACPGFKEFPDLTTAGDLDGALALAGVDAVIVGGEPDLRAEGLRRVAAVGYPCICLHPPGVNADPYYQIALSQQETGALVVPDLPGRLHPAISAFAKVLGDGRDLGEFRVLRYDVPAGAGETDLAGHTFPNAVDLMRLLLGEIEAVTATGDPPGDRPTQSLVVQLRARDARRGEIRIVGSTTEPARLVISAAEGTLTREHVPSYHGQSQLDSTIESPNDETIASRFRPGIPTGRSSRRLPRSSRARRRIPI